MAIKRSPLWSKIALLIVHDEHGGIYDATPLARRYGQSCPYVMHAATVTVRQRRPDLP